MSIENNTVNYACYQHSDGTFVPETPLDHILCAKSTSYPVTYYSFYDGTQVDENNIDKFRAQVVEQIEKRAYTHSDHLFIATKVSGCSILYVSLENSCRSANNGYPLRQRLANICDAVRSCLPNLDKECVVFFSESCRKIGGFDWFEIRRIISKSCGLEYLGECANNDDPSMMAFGVSAFATEAAMDRIQCVLPRRILTEGFGSGAVGIKLDSDEIVWGIHMPLDFKSGETNKQLIAMRGLSEVMRTRAGSVLAIGDFNTVPGVCNRSVSAGIDGGMQMLGWSIPTFFGSFFDAVVPREDGTEWIVNKN